MNQLSGSGCQGRLSRRPRFNRDEYLEKQYHQPSPASPSYTNGADSQNFPNDRDGEGRRESKDIVVVLSPTGVGPILSLIHIYVIRVHI